MAFDIVACPCGISKMDCEYHKELAPKSANTGALPGPGVTAQNWSATPANMQRALGQQSLAQQQQLACGLARGLGAFVPPITSPPLIAARKPSSAWQWYIGRAGDKYWRAQFCKDPNGQAVASNCVVISHDDVLELFRIEDDAKRLGYVVPV